MRDRWGFNPPLNPHSGPPLRGPPRRSRRLRRRPHLAGDENPSGGSQAPKENIILVFGFQIPPRTAAPSVFSLLLSTRRGVSFQGLVFRLIRPLTIERGRGTRRHPVATGATAEDLLREYRILDPMGIARSARWSSPTRAAIFPDAHTPGLRRRRPRPLRSRTALER